VKTQVMIPAGRPDRRAMVREVSQNWRQAVDPAPSARRRRFRVPIR